MQPLLDSECSGLETWVAQDYPGMLSFRRIFTEQFRHQYEERSCQRRMDVFGSPPIDQLLGRGCCGPITVPVLREISVFQWRWKVAQ